MKWKMVPVEPTREMLDAGQNQQWAGEGADDIYAAMLAAAPEFEPDDKMVERASRCFQMTLYAQLGSTPADAVRAALKALFGGK